MKTLSKEAEDKLLSAIQSVCDEVDGGLEPTAAVVKIAEEFQLTPNFIRLVSHGYNTGATTYQRENNTGILEKMAEFPLADAEAAIKQMYPKDVPVPGREKESTSVSVEYARIPLPLRRKAASALPELPELETVPQEPSEVLSEHKAALAVKRAYAEVASQQKLIEQKRLDYTQAQDCLVSSLGKLAEAVKCSSVWSAQDVGAAAESRYGAHGKAIGKFLAVRDPGIKKASAGFKAVDWQQEPFSLIPEIVKQAAAVKQLQQVYKQAVASGQEKEAAVFSPFGESLPQEPVILLKESAGFLTGLMAGSIPRSVATTLATPKQTSELVDDAEMDLSDPDDDNIRRIAAVQTMLSDFTHNDDVISGYEPEEVYTAYNEIAGMAPRISTQPAAMRALLRKRLTQGAMEPFEAQEVVNMEKTIGEAQNPRLSFFPDKRGAVNVLANRTLLS